MKALVGAFNQEKALVGAFSVIVQPVVDPMDRFTALNPGEESSDSGSEDNSSGGNSGYNPGAEIGNGNSGFNPGFGNGNSGYNPGNSFTPLPGRGSCFNVCGNK